MAELAGEDVRARLQEPPRRPAEPRLFSADSDYAGPGIYAGPAMMPAEPPSRSEEEFGELVSRHSLAPASAAGWFTDSRVEAVAPEPAVRAALALLSGTIADGTLTRLVENSDIAHVGIGTPEGAGRIVGHGPQLNERLVSARYRFEHPALLAGPLAHELICSPTPRCDAEEKFTHGVLAMVHMQLIARVPGLAQVGTELSRRVNSIALSLYNSRPRGLATFRFIAPDGPGTIPGGQPSMQSPDFWSIPFLSGYPDAVAMPPAAVGVLEQLGCGRSVFAGAPSYENSTIVAIDDSMGLGWLGWEARGRVGRAFGLL